MTRQLQTSTELAYYSQTVELDGSTFLLVFRWNARREYWSVDIFDVDGNPIALARKILVDVDLVKQRHHAGAPAGVLFAWESKDQKEKPGVDELGSRVLLLYLEESELAAV
jgi:hypothetical protein